MKKLLIQRYLNENRWQGSGSKTDPKNMTRKKKAWSTEYDSKLAECIKSELREVQKKTYNRKNIWGNLSYVELITKAIETSPCKSLTLSEICYWFRLYIPYFKNVDEIVLKRMKVN